MPQKSPPDSEQVVPAPTTRRLWLRYLLVAYLLALALSHLIRHLAPAPPLPAGYQAVELLAVADGQRTNRPVRVSYLEWPTDGEVSEAEEISDQGNKSSPPVILLVHGSPGSASNFNRLGPLLDDRHRVLAVDLPGFGAAERHVPNYSIEAHAHYLVDFLDALDIANVHAVGFSMGGGVVLHLEELVPDRVASVTMLAAIGVQELELLGEYNLNHALHGLQLGVLWLLSEATPHFGVFDRGGLNVPYARNFFDTDQRPLRGLLERFEKPMLILHGEGDVLVPYAAAVEHHRLVPHSRLVSWNTNHFMVFRAPGELAAPMLDFFTAVEAGTAPRRADAAAERLAAAEDPGGFKPQRIAGFALTLTLVLLALSTLASEDLACIAAGLLVARGSLGFFEATVACGTGIFLGDLMLYFAGRLGRSGVHRAPLRWFVKPKALERSQRWFARRGALVILLSRFIPGTRLPTYVAAGVLRMPVLWFTLNLFVPVALWTPFLVGSSHFLGEGFFATFEQFQRYALPSFVAFLLTLWLLLGLGQSLLTWQGRRHLVGRWRRLCQWEFWPPWLFYPPVVLHILGLGLRYRSATLFTAANPGIPAGGGVLGESKSTILKCLDPRFVAPFEELPGHLSPTARRDLVEDFQKRHGLDYPIVLKPDQGQRGSGVVIARNGAQMRAFLEQSRGDALVQKYIFGPELGIFYVRLPGDEKGRIFSITEKVLPELVGDGRSTVERLILADERAVALAPLYLDRLDARLEEVPAQGERVPLAELGTHCLGAVFLDGSVYNTPALEAAIENISRSFEGFYFGRFDIRAESKAAFHEGRDLRVLELNGVTSEATHIYDPKNRLRDAYRVLWEQWSLAFKIGQRNRDQGFEPLSLIELARLVITFRPLRK